MIFIQIFGGHAVGKSSIAGYIKEKYNKNICVLGKYKKSKTSIFYTGGMDALSYTNEQRFDYIKEEWMKEENKIILCEGMIISYFESFFKKYYDLQKIKKRKVIALYLFCSKEKMLERIEKRSGGKQLNEKRLNNIVSKARHANILYNKLLPYEDFIKIKSDTTDDEKFEIIKKDLSILIEKELNIR